MWLEVWKHNASYVRGLNDVDHADLDKNECFPSKGTKPRCFWTFTRKRNNMTQDLPYNTQTLSNINHTDSPSFLFWGGQIIFSADKKRLILSAQSLFVRRTKNTEFLYLFLGKKTRVFVRRHGHNIIIIVLCYPDPSNA